MGNLIFRLGKGQWAMPELMGLLEKAVSGEGQFDNYIVKHDFENIGYKVMSLSVRRIELNKELPKQILLVIEDITGKAGDEAGH